MKYIHDVVLQGLVLDEQFAHRIYFSMFLGLCYGIGAIIWAPQCQENNIDDISKNVPYQNKTKQEFSV